MQSISKSCSFEPFHHFGTKVTLAIVLSISLLVTGCSAAWISTALADLPVLTQMALNVATLVTTLQSGQQIDPAEVTAVQNISSEASRDLALLQGFYNQYKSNPNADTLQKIQSTISTITETLPALLQSAHVSDPTLSARVTAGVNLILTTVASFSALMPQATPAASQRIAGMKVSIPSAKELKKQWNLQVCAPSPTFHSALSVCVVR